MARFLINVHTAWCGEEETFAAIAKNDCDPQLLNKLDELAYDNFLDGNGVDEMYREEFPDIDREDLTYEDIESIDEGNYYGGDIEEWDETRPEEEWNWYELVYNSEDSEDSEVKEAPKMQRYRIFAGLGGGFGGANYQYTEEFKSEDEANDAAYIEACQIYDSQEGCGIDGWNEFMDEARQGVSEEDFEDDEAGYESALEEYARQASDEARESWVDWSAELIGPDQPDNPDDE